MPCATIHLLLAERILTGWESAPSTAPVPVGRPEVRTAFLHGALAPDMGFIPGVDRFVSELAHYHSPAALTRALLGNARDVVDQAFAWGWATHVVGDVGIHPVVGRMVGEFLHGDRDRRVDAREDVEAHVSLEVGLDLVFLSERAGIPPPPAEPHRGGSGLGPVLAALREVYGLRWRAAELARDHRQAVRMTRWWPRALRALRFLPAGLERSAERGSALRGFLRPRRPPEWAIDEVRTQVEAFPDTFLPVIESGMSGLAERNLETGGPAGAGRGHAASDAVAERLDRLRGRTSSGGG